MSEPVCIQNRKYYESPDEVDVKDFNFSRKMIPSYVDITYHEHNLYEIFFLTSGSLAFYIMGKDYVLRPGDIVIVKPGEIHRQVTNGGESYERVNIWINEEYLQSVANKYPDIANFFQMVFEHDSYYLSPDEEAVKNIRRVLTKLEISCKSDKNKSIKHDYLRNILLYICGLVNGYQYVIEDKNVNKKIAAMIEYIKNNLCTELSLDKLSEIFHISKYHLSREFTRYVGCTLHKYVLDKRLNLAKELIDTGNDPVAVYLKCGFDEYSTFIKAFKKNFGLTPRKYLTLSTVNSTNLKKDI